MNRHLIREVLASPGQPHVTPLASLLMGAIFLAIFIVALIGLAVEYGRMLRDLPPQE